jgi:uncharacterized membrane protein YheB (UPF0754 family)
MKNHTNDTMAFIIMKDVPSYVYETFPKMQVKRMIDESREKFVDTNQMTIEEMQAAFATNEFWDNIINTMSPQWKQALKEMKEKEQQMGN